MNKTAIGTILGSALLATLKRKGSSATDTRRVIIKKAKRFYVDFEFTIHELNLPVQLFVDEYGVQEELSNYSIILVENKIDEIENMLNTKVDFEKFWLSEPFFGLNYSYPDHMRIFYKGRFTMGDDLNEEAYNINEWNYKPKYDINGNLEENQELKRLRCFGNLYLYVERSQNQEKVSAEYFEPMLSNHVLKKLKEFIENETNLEISFDSISRYRENEGEDTLVFYTIENGEEVLWNEWKVKAHDSSFLPKIRVK